jgi:hypothetical protein
MFQFWQPAQKIVRPARHCVLMTGTPHRPFGSADYSEPRADGSSSDIAAVVSRDRERYPDERHFVVVH